MQLMLVAMSQPRKRPRSLTSLGSPWQLALRPQLCSKMGITSFANETVGAVRLASVSYWTHSGAPLLPLPLLPPLPLEDDPPEVEGPPEELPELDEPLLAPEEPFGAGSAGPDALEHPSPVTGNVAPASTQSAAIADRISSCKSRTPRLRTDCRTRCC